MVGKWLETGGVWPPNVHSSYINFCKIIALEFNVCGFHSSIIILKFIGKTLVVAGDILII